MLHIPSGIIINMNAKFKEDRNFQIASSVVMLIGMMILGYFFKLEGIMLGITLGSLTLGVCEVYYTRNRIFHLGYIDYFKPILIDLIVLIPAILIECKFFKDKKLHELSDEFSISPSRISRIIKQGLDKIKDELVKSEII